MRESKAERAGKAFEKRLREGDSGFVDGVQQLRSVAESIRLLESPQDCPEHEQVRVELQAVLDEYLPQLAADKARIQADSERMGIPGGFDDDPLEWCQLACEILEADPETVSARDLYRKLKARYWKKRQDAKAGQDDKAVGSKVTPKDGSPKAKGGRRDGETVNDAMIRISNHKKTACLSWTQRDWAEKLNCSPASVGKSSMWKAILKERESSRQNRRAKE